MNNGIDNNEGADKEHKSTQNEIGEGVRKSLKDLIGNGTVDDYLKSLTDISLDDAKYFIRIGQGGLIGNYFEKIPETDREEVALMLLENRLYHTLAKNLSKIKISDGKILFDLLEKIWPGYYCDNVNWESFWPDDSGNKNAEADREEELRKERELFDFIWPDDSGNKNAKADREEELRKERELFDFIFESAKSNPIVFEKFLDMASSDDATSRHVIRKMGSLPAIYQEKVKEAKKHLSDLSAEDLNETKVTDKEVVMKLIDNIEDNGDWDEFLDNIDNFSGLDSEVAARIIDAGFWRDVLKNIECFKGLNKEIALKILDQKDYDGYCFEHLYSFDGFLTVDAVLKIIEDDLYPDSRVLKKYIMKYKDRFSNQDLRRINSKLREFDINPISIDKKNKK